MENQVLEQRTNKTLPQEGTRTAECHYCGTELQIPKGILLEKNTEYDGFYVSPERNIHCNRGCFTMFTED